MAGSAGVVCACRRRLALCLPRSASSCLAGCGAFEELQQPTARVGSAGGLFVQHSTSEDRIDSLQLCWMRAADCRTGATRRGRMQEVDRSMAHRGTGESSCAAASLLGSALKNSHREVR